MIQMPVIPYTRILKIELFGFDLSFHRKLKVAKKVWRSVMRDIWARFSAPKHSAVFIAVCRYINVQGHICSALHILIYSINFPLNWMETLSSFVSGVWIQQQRNLYWEIFKITSIYKLLFRWSSVHNSVNISSGQASHRKCIFYVFS